MKLVTSTGPNEAIVYLADVLQKQLGSDKRVLWLIPGGSAIAVAAGVSKLLAGQDLHNLTVSVTDERYGEMDHSDENWTQLLVAGLVLPGARLYRVLNGQSREQTTAAYGSFLFEAFDSCDYAIGLFGIGSDGHTAGIKPQSSAIIDDVYAADFDYPDFQRITMTTYAISKLDEAVVYAQGQDKFPVVSQLLHEDVPIDVQPAQILKKVPKSTIFSDFAETK